MPPRQEEPARSSRTYSPQYPQTARPKEVESGANDLAAVSTLRDGKICRTDDYATWGDALESDAVERLSLVAQSGGQPLGCPAVEALDPVEIRVLGCLLEKQRSTPDAYPLTLNSLRIACNQSTNRDPVVAYDEATVREAAQRLGRRGWARLASYHGSRSPKYRHLLDEALGLSLDEQALLCALMLRGPQTLGELKQRSERLHAFADLRSVEETLDRLTTRSLGSWRERKPGQKEARYMHLLEVERTIAAEADPAPVAGGPAAHETQPPDLAAEVARLRQEVDALRRDVAALREQLNT
jgi:uncharacterized protein